MFIDGGRAVRGAVPHLHELRDQRGDLQPECVELQLTVPRSGQAKIAWVLRRDPPLTVAWMLGLYQIPAAFVDVALWVLLADQGIFPLPMARSMVVAAIAIHLSLGVLLLDVGVAPQRGGATCVAWSGSYGCARCTAWAAW